MRANEVGQRGMLLSGIAPGGPRGASRQAAGGARACWLIRNAAVRLASACGLSVTNRAVAGSGSSGATEGVAAAFGWSSAQTGQSSSADPLGLRSDLSDPLGRAAVDDSA